MVMLLQVYMLPWYVRKAAATLYAEPPTATLQDALKSCLKVSFAMFSVDNYQVLHFS